MIPSRLILCFSGALALVSCNTVDDPQQNPADAYGAANAYNHNPNANANAGGYGYPAYGQGGQYSQPPGGAYGGAAPYGAANPGAGAYSPPGYSQPYTQPADTGYGGAYTAPPPAGNYGAASGRSHTVASGDNLSKIARRYGVTTDALMRANNLTDPNFIRAGQTLTIP
jgi:LysM repeat protein